MEEAYDPGAVIPIHWSIEPFLVCIVRGHVSNIYISTYVICVYIECLCVFLMSLRRGGQQTLTFKNVKYAISLWT